MKVVHCVQVGPNRCGLYGTARDLLKAEIKYGINAGLLDVTPVTTGALINGVMEGYPKARDPSVTPKSYGWAKKADIFIRHSYIPAALQALGKPLVLALHGRPESSFRLETQTKQTIMSTVYKRGQDKRYKAFLCFWPEYMVPWQLVVPQEKLFYVPAPVDLEYYSPEGDVFDISQKAGEPNILIVDIWREDIIPLDLLYAATVFQQKYCKTAKLHILALQGKNLRCLMPTLAEMNKIGVLGGVVGLNPKVNEFYRAADMVITPHTIATRTVREPLACGVPVVAGTGNRYTPYTANPRDIEGFAKAINDCWQDLKEDKGAIKVMARKTAEIAFNLDNTGKAVKEVLEGIL
jgi:glycosyltransferase involved in cell wall biosynthesis